MTVRDYLSQAHHLRFVVAAPVLPEGPERELTAEVLSAHRTLEAAKEAVRWERARVRKETGDRDAVVDLIVVDMETARDG
jgi:hypothetical protein